MNENRERNHNRALQEIDQAVKQKTYPRQEPHSAITIDVIIVIGYIYMFFSTTLRARKSLGYDILMIRY